jgi:predicted outer membrane repeat protein
MTLHTKQEETIMKKMICRIMSLVVAVACVLPAAALDSEPSADTPAPAVVSTADELLEAIGAAEDGDTISLSQTITPWGNTNIGTTEKHLNLVRAEAFSGPMFSCTTGEITFENLSIDGGNANFKIISSICPELHLKDVYICNSGDSAVSVTQGDLIIENCRFENNTAQSGGHIWLMAGVTAEIKGTSFVGGSGGAIWNTADLYIEDCLFTGNSADGGGGAIHTVRGRCEVVGSTITGNSTSGFGGGGGIYNRGTLALSDTEIYGNTSTLCGADIFSYGSLDISASSDDLNEIYQVEGRTPLGFYTDITDARFNGEDNVTTLQPLPISSEDGVVALIFAFEDDMSASSGNVPEEPQEVEEPQETQEDGGGDQDAQPEVPAEQQEPENEPSGPVVPEPSTYTPAPAWSYTSSPDDGDDQEPEPEQEPEQEPEPPVLICGGAALDTSNRAYLAGYGDGVIGEDDLITRAQIAQIIYRLLTEESREVLETSENSFEDVPALAWYNLPVSTIARAGIVVGYGGSFHPGGYLTRAQLITIMARFITPVEGESSFTDISGHWAETFIRTAEAVGWLDGGSDFRPDEYVTRGEVVNFINHVFDLCEKAG